MKSVQMTGNQLVVDLHVCDLVQTKMDNTQFKHIDINICFHSKFQRSFYRE